jgi:predicted DNA-binding transcriptional regulator AlpA
MNRRPSPPPTPQASALPIPPAPESAGRITLRLDELAAALGVSRRTLERERSAGRFPRPDLHIGKAPLWRPETIHRWIEGGGA